MARPLSGEETVRLCNIIIRAFRWQEPLPEGFSDRMARFFSGEDRSEEMWSLPYRMTKEEVKAAQEEPKDAMWKVEAFLSEVERGLQV